MPRPPHRRLDVDGLALLGFVALVTTTPVVAALVRGRPFDASTNVAAALATLSFLAIGADLLRTRHAQRSRSTRREPPARGGER